MKNLWFRLRAIWRSRDKSTPERPRRDGSYGWPRPLMTESGMTELERKLVGRIAEIHRAAKLVLDSGVEMNDGSISVDCESLVALRDLLERPE